MIPNHKVFSALSRAEIEQKIDAFLDEGTPFKDLSLILAVHGSSRTSYRGVSVREWHAGSNVRFDSAVELTD